MNTDTRATGVQQYSSPLRISTEAVELRDITYPMSDVKSVEIVTAVSKRPRWDTGILMFDSIGGALVAQSWIDSGVWEGKAGVQTLAMLVAATVAFLAITYLLRWLYKRSSKKGAGVYAAELDTEYGRTLIAASRDKAYMERVAATVTAAIAEHRKRAQPTAQEEDATQARSYIIEPESEAPLRTPVLYENYFRIDDSNVSTPNWTEPISSVKSARSVALSARNNSYASSSIWYPVFVLLLISALRLQSVFGNSYFLPILYVGVIALIFMVWKTDIKKKRKKEVPTANTVYIGTLEMAGDDMPTLISMDYGFVEKFVSSVKEAVRKHKASTGKPASATRPSQGST